MKYLFIRILRQLKNDKRSLALIFIAPLLVITLLYLLLGESNYEPKLAVKDFPEVMVNQLEENEDASVVIFPGDKKIEEYLKDKQADAVISLSDSGINIKMLENDSIKPALILNIVKKSLVSNKSDIKLDFIYGPTDNNIFYSMAYVILGFVSFFFVFLLAGISFIREKNYSTMERMMMTPIKRWEVIAGYTLGFGCVGVVQSTTILLYTKYILNVPFEGSILIAMLMMVMISLAAVSMGAFISIFSHNEFQIMQFIPIVVIPQLFFSGLISLETIPLGLGNLAYVMPIYYGCNGLDKVLVRGEGLSGISTNIIALLIVLIFFSIINILVLKRYRRI